MYERLLDKQREPTAEEFERYCGECGELFKRVNDFLLNRLGAERLLRFPYGNSYGWGMKYFKKSRHICDVFAEKDAFTVMLRLTNAQFDRARGVVTEHTRECIDKKYPCGEGGWIHCRVLNERHLADIEKLLELKMQK